MCDKPKFKNLYVFSRSCRHAAWKQGHLAAVGGNFPETNDIIIGHVWDAHQQW